MKVEPGVRNLAIILGIDAAWTQGGSSGIALFDSAPSRRRIVYAAPSYDAFIDHNANAGWHKPTGGSPNVRRLLAAAEELGGAAVDVVVIDMPISKRPIIGRREADQAISRAFGAAGAGTHSPSIDRPGRHGVSLTNAFKREGFMIATGGSRYPRSVIEAYPLAALVRLMHLAKRPGYKAAKTLTYWPGLSLVERGRCLRKSWQDIEAALEPQVGPFGFKFPSHPESFASLKPYEDMLDAIICCWIGACFAEGAAEPFGDNDAAIWVPIVSS